MNRGRAICALKRTVILTLVVALVEVGCTVYLMVTAGLPFREAFPNDWIFSVKGLLECIGGWIFCFFFIYFAETDKLE